MRAMGRCRTRGTCDARIPNERQSNYSKRAPSTLTRRRLALQWWRILVATSTTRSQRRPPTTYPTNHPNTCWDKGAKIVRFDRSQRSDVYEILMYGAFYESFQRWKINYAPLSITYYRYVTLVLAVLLPILYLLSFTFFSHVK